MTSTFGIAAGAGYYTHHPPLCILYCKGGLFMAVYQNGIDVSRYQGNINWGRVAAAGKQLSLIHI